MVQVEDFEVETDASSGRMPWARGSSAAKPSTSLRISVIACGVDRKTARELFRRWRATA